MIHSVRQGAPRDPWLHQWFWWVEPFSEGRSRCTSGQPLEKQDGIAAAGLVAAVLDEDSNSKLWKADG